MNLSLENRTFTPKIGKRFSSDHITTLCFYCQYPTINSYETVFTCALQRSASLFYTKWRNVFPFFLAFSQCIPYNQSGRVPYTIILLYKG